MRLAEPAGSARGRLVGLSPTPEGVDYRMRPQRQAAILKKARVFPFSTRIPETMSAAILVPLDGSDFAEQALPVARNLAAQLNAPIHLLAVYQPIVPVATTPSIQLYDRTYDAEQALRLADTLRARAEALAKEVPTGVTHSVVESQKVVDAILEEAGKVGARFLVTTTHGRGGFQRFWLGSVADGLVRAATLPVLLVRPKLPEQEPQRTELQPVGEPPQAQPFRKLLLPLDGSPLSEQAIKPGLELLAPEGASVRLLRVVTIPPTRLAPQDTFWTPLEQEAFDERRAEATAYLEDIARNDLPSSVDASISAPLHASPAMAIIEEAGEWGADIIAMSTNAREGFTRLVVGSVADKVYRGAEVPTLVVPPKR